MKAQSRIWTKGNIIRHYVTAGKEAVGYIELNMVTAGYGEGYYANHRACKGDNGTITVSETTFVGNEAVLQSYLEAVKQQNPNLDIDAALLRYSANAVCFGCKPKSIII